MKVRIFTANMGTSSYGKADEKWFLQTVDGQNIRHTEPLMGWTSVDGADQQLKLRFDSKDLAVKYAEDKGYEYSVQEEVRKKIPKKSYAENFG